MKTRDWQDAGDIPAGPPGGTDADGCGAMIFSCPPLGGALFDTLFATNAAPIILIDPEADGAIVDVNVKATEFYGYDRDTFRRLHVWDINTLGRSVLPVMREISSWSGGHFPQRFRHRLADGSIRDVQVYAGPVEMAGRTLLLCIIHDVTAVLEVEQFNRLLLESIDVGVCGLDSAGRITFANAEALRAFGCSHESQLAHRSIAGLIGPLVPEAAADHPLVIAARLGTAFPRSDCQMFRVDGSPFPARAVAQPLRAGDDRRGLVLSFTDLTAEREREDQLADLIHALPGAVFQARVTARGRIEATFFSAAARALFDLPSGADPARPAVLAPLLPRGEWRRLLRGLAEAARDHKPREWELSIRGPDGGRWLLCRAQPRARPAGLTLFNGVLLDITDRKQLEASLEAAALTDPLTGLWNRRRFEKRLGETLDDHRQTARPFSLAIIDIDRFKRLNDLHGHDIGDETLRRVAAVLRLSTRPADCLARWGGEEFVLLLPDTGVAAAETLARDILAAVAATDIPEAGHVTVSIGVGEVRAGESREDLFRRIDAALYRAKDAGRACVRTA